MERCTNKTGLHVHHKRINGGNALNNAQVLCERCHMNTLSYGHSDHTPPRRFSQATRRQALENAGHQCECTKISGCH